MRKCLRLKRKKNCQQYSILSWYLFFESVGSVETLPTSFPSSNGRSVPRKAYLIPILSYQAILRLLPQSLFRTEKATKAETVSTPQPWLAHRHDTTLVSNTSLRNHSGACPKAQEKKTLRLSDYCMASSVQWMPKENSYRLSRVWPERHLPLGPPWSPSNSYDYPARLGWNR